jgi:hypothetical protein
MRRSERQQAQQNAEEVRPIITDLYQQADGHVIEDHGTPVPQRASLNFEGPGVSLSDSGSKTIVTITGGSGSGFDLDEGGASMTYTPSDTLDLEEGSA